MPLKEVYERTFDEDVSLSEADSALPAAPSDRREETQHRLVGQSEDSSEENLTAGES